jgi:hypothetical protein
MANELAVRCCTSATLDVKYVKSRVEHEGLSFLAITLADYGKAIERWLDQGFVVPSDASSFKTGSLHIGFPPFLGGFLGLVFDRTSGVLLESPSIEAIYSLRQLTLVFGKIALPDATSNGGISLRGNRQVVSQERERRAMVEYLQCERDVREADARLFPHDWEDLRLVSTLLYEDLFAKVNQGLPW